MIGLLFILCFFLFWPSVYRCCFPYRSDNGPEVFPDSVGSVSDHAGHVIQQSVHAIKESEDEALANANDDDGPRSHVIIQQLQDVHSRARAQGKACEKTKRKWKEC